MRVPLEDWLNSQMLTLEAKSSFKESFVCFRAGAHKAGLLFAYLGFMTAIRDRVLASPAPAGIAATHWQTIQKRLKSAETWDSTAFEATQQKNPAPIFVVTDDLRNQVKFWKDRRNDCAHSKDNKITVAYVETLYVFIESNLNKFVVNGSRNEMLRRIADHFDPSLTPPGTPPDPIVRDLPNAIAEGELCDFMSEVASQFDNARDSIAVMFNSVSPQKIDFFNTCMQLGSQHLVETCQKVLLSDSEFLLAFLRAHSDKVTFLKGHPPKVRQLWHDFLFLAANNDFPLLSSLLRSELIPPKEKEEALLHVIKKGIAGVPNDIDNVTLEESGFYRCLESVMTTGLEFSDFSWANKTKGLVIKYLSDHPITEGVAGAIYQYYNVTNHPWHMASYLDNLFRSNPKKRQEYIGLANTHEDIGCPAHIPSLHDQ